MKIKSSPIFAPKELLLLLLYVAALILISTFHEMWRDEVRALSIVRASDSIPALFANLKNEGHPALWYLILWVLNLFSSSAFILPVASISVATIAAVIWIRNKNFSFLDRSLWLFGLLPLYEYSVQCRNYGIGMLLLFLYCSCYSQRKLKPICCALVLALLANTSLYGLLFASVLLLIRTAELRSAEIRSIRIIVGLVVTVAGLLLAALQMYPDSNSLVVKQAALTPTLIGEGLIASFFAQGSYATQALSLRFSILPVVFLLPLYIAFRKTPYALIYLLLIALGLDFINRSVYPGVALRHQGFFILAILSSIWINRIYLNQTSTEAVRPTFGLAQLILSLLLILQIDSAMLRVSADVKHPMSSAQSVATLINSDETLRAAIIVAEPDYYAETLPYYTKNRIYLPRQDNFAKLVSFTNRNKTDLSMKDLVDTAQRLKQEFNVPIVLLYGHSFSTEGEHSFSFGKTFSFTNEQRELFKQRFKLKTRLLNSLTDENYNLYLFE